jgi:hypothetical protein
MDKFRDPYKLETFIKNQDIIGFRNCVLINDINLNNLNDNGKNILKLCLDNDLLLESLFEFGLKRDIINEIYLDFCRTGDLFGIRKCIYMGCDVNYEYGEGFFICVEKGYTKVCTYLLEKGIDSQSQISNIVRLCLSDNDITSLLLNMDHKYDFILLKAIKLNKPNFLKSLILKRIHLTDNKTKLYFMNCLFDKELYDALLYTDLNMPWLDFIRDYHLNDKIIEIYKIIIPKLDYRVRKTLVMFLVTRNKNFLNFVIDTYEVKSSDILDKMIKSLIKHGDIEYLKKIFDNFSINIKKYSNKLIRTAIMSCDEKFIDFVLDLDIDKLCSNQIGFRLAVKYEMTKYVKYFIDNNADVHIKNDQCFRNAVYMNNIDIFFLLKSKSKYIPKFNILKLVKNRNFDMFIEITKYQDYFIDSDLIKIGIESENYEFINLIFKTVDVDQYYNELIKYKISLRYYLQNVKIVDNPNLIVDKSIEYNDEIILELLLKNNKINDVTLIKFNKINDNQHNNFIKILINNGYQLNQYAKMKINDKCIISHEKIDIGMLFTKCKNNHFYLKENFDELQLINMNRICCYCDDIIENIIYQNY